MTLAQQESLDLMNCFKRICEKNNFQYSLLYTSVLAYKLYDGLFPWEPRMQVGLFYSDYCKFLEICEEEIDPSQYYLMHDKNTEQFEEFYCRLGKKSRILLPKSRGKDQIYYDYKLDIYPIFFAGDTKREAKKLIATYKKINQRRLSIRVPKDIFRGCRSLKGKKRIAARMIQFAKKKPNDFENLRKKLTKIMKPTTYVFILGLKSLDGVASLYTTYTNTSSVMIQGFEYKIMNKPKQWITDFYSEEQLLSLEKKAPNQTAIEGPEALRRIQLIELEMLVEFDRICRMHNIKYILGAGTVLGAVRHKGFVPWDDDVDVFMRYKEMLKFEKVVEKEMDHERFFYKSQKTDKDCNLTYPQLKRNGTVYSKEGREVFQTHHGVPMDILLFFDAPKLFLIRKLQDRICKYYRQMTWAHIGAHTERDEKKKKKYMRLAKNGNKYASEKFVTYATKWTGKSLAYYSITRNYVRNPINNLKMFENTMEMEFEGHKFFVMKDWDEYLIYGYSKDYMRFPSVGNRTTIKHMPAVVDLGNLFSYEKGE